MRNSRPFEALEHAGLAQLVLLLVDDAGLDLLLDVQQLAAERVLVEEPRLDLAFDQARDGSDEARTSP